MRRLGCHADGFPKRRVRVNGLADVHRVGAHLDGQCDFTNHVAGVGADHATAQNPAVTMRFFAVVKQQLGKAFVAAVGNGTPGCAPGEQALLQDTAEGSGRQSVLNCGVMGFGGAIIVAWYSRQREYRADCGSADLMGRPQAMGINGAPSGLMALFSSHPPIEQRIAALQNAQR